MAVAPIRFLMVGGFLGAGKTTTIARLARHFLEQGQRVGLVTNDQAFDLVDTHSLRSQGFAVGEVPGACFCCKFDDLIDTMRELCETERPDVIIAEPVGSCTDLVATVVEPMRGLYGDRFQPGRFAVLLKPEHGLKILRQQPQLGFSEQAAYIFRKQLEEADVVVINKIDKLLPAAVDELAALVAEAFPGKPCLKFSATTGAGFGGLMAVLEQPASAHREFMEVDYDVYAEGEAELGWLNATVHFDLPQPTPLDKLARTIVSEVQSLLETADVEAAHLKVLAADRDSNAAIANLVGTEAEIDLSMRSAASAQQIDVTVNARVATGPDELDDLIRAAVDSAAQHFEAACEFRSLQKLSPGRPVPTHRMTS